MTILVVEDDEDISKLLKRGFEMEGYRVECAATGEAAIKRSLARPYNSIILDVMLPGCSGLEVCRDIRKRRQDASIIMLSARDTVPDRIEGLTAGADDYVVKPFAFEELLARVRAQERKKTLGGSTEDVPEIGGLKFDVALRKAEFGGKSVVLTKREADLIMLFMRNARKPLTRDDIYRALWADQGCNALNVVDVYVGYLRRKLSTIDIAAKSTIKTMRGTGFVLDPD